MRIEKVKVADLFRVDEFAISIPPDAGLHEVFLKNFPGITPIITDPEKNIISGHDSYDFIRNSGTEYCEVLVSPLEKKESLFLAYNSRAVLKPLSIYEKLVFLKNIIKYSEISEIYLRTGIGIRIDKKLISLIPELTSDSFRELLSGDLISLRTAVKLCSFNEEDKKLMITLFTMVRFSNSNEQKLLDMATEICFRDKTGFSGVFQKINVEKLYEEENPGSEILSALSQLRYPAYSDQEKEWKNEIGKIKLPFNYSIHHYPFFEKRGIELKLFLDSLEKIREISEKFKD